MGVSVLHDKFGRFLDVPAIAESAADVAEFVDVAGKVQIVGFIAVLQGHDGKFARFQYCVAVLITGVVGQNINEILNVLRDG